MRLLHVTPPKVLHLYIIGNIIIGNNCVVFISPTSVKSVIKSTFVARVTVASTALLRPHGAGGLRAKTCSGVGFRGTGSQGSVMIFTSSSLLGAALLPAEKDSSSSPLLSCINVPPFCRQRRLCGPNWRRFANARPQMSHTNSIGNR